MRSSKLIAFGALVALGGVLHGCGARQTGTTPPIVELRRQAAANPDDPALMRELAIGEMLWEDGDPERATAALARWRSEHPSAEAALLAGADHYFHGEPAAALEAFLVALESQPSALIAEEAAAGVEEVLGLAPNVFAIAPRLEAVAPNLPLGARQTVVDMLSNFAYRQGQPGRLEGLRDIAQCIGEWRVAGPFGPRTQLGFDQSHAADAAGALADSYDLGTGRGERPTRTIDARGCSVHLGEGPVAGGGTSYAEAFVQTEAGVHTLRLETPNSVEVKVDGEVVARIDHRRNPLRRVTLHRLELSAGRHEISVKITTRHPNPVMVVSLLPGDHRVAIPEDDSALSCYLRSGLFMSRGRTIDARESLEACPASPQILSYRAAVSLRDPFVTDDMRRDGSRQLSVELAARDDRAWIPVLQLARLKAAEGRDQEAIADLRAAAGRWPELSSIPLALADMLLSRGWDAEARGYIAQALRVAPGTCAPIEAALAEAQRRDRIAEIDSYTDQLMACDARGGERYAQLISARRWEDARAELQRLQGLDPAHRRLRFTGNLIDLAAAQGQPRTPLLERYAEAHPRSDGTRLALADQLLAAGDRAGALALLDEAITEEPAAMLSLQRIRAALGGNDEFADYRLDGLAALREFDASEQSYDEPQVLVLDYTVQRVFDDASSLALTHQIYKLQSEEAVDAQGEFAVPEDAYLLTLRTIKADGTVLEPDLIAGKETISLPHLAVGDSVEYEYVRVLGPASGLPGGLLGDRFYFASYEVPFHRTELVVVAPEAMEIVVDPRGDAPELRRSSRNGLQELRWRADQVAPLVAEPASIAGREFMPSINWGVAATWEGLMEGLRDVLVDREVIDPDAVALARQITRGANSDREKAQRVFAWVLDNVENTDSVFGAAAPMLAGRTGNRARIIHYLLGLIDVPSSLVLARNFAGDQTVGTIADETTYSTLLVRVGEGTEADFLVSASRGVPYGYVPQAFRGQEALVLSPFNESDEVVRLQVPAGTTPDTRNIEIRALVGDHGEGRVEVTETYQGSGAIEWRGDLEGIPAAVLSQRFEEGYVARLIPAGRLIELEIRGQESAEEPLVMRYVVESPALGRQQGDQVLLNAFFPTVLGPRFARVASRQTPQLVGPALDITVTIDLRLANGRTPPARQAVNLEGPGGARFSSEAHVGNGGMQIRRHLEMPLMRVSPEDYPSFAAFCRSVDEAEARAVPLN